MAKNWMKAFTTAEIRDLRTVSNLHGAWMTASNLLLIGGMLTLAALVPGWHTAAAAVVVIGARQLGMAVVMHEAAHRTLFRQRWLNDAVGNWLGAYWIGLRVQIYRPYHLQHHAYVGTERDPDLPLKRGYPTTPASMTRKVLRDLSGYIGLKRLLGTTYFFAKASLRRADAPPLITPTGNELPRRDARRALLGFAATQLALAALLWLLGVAWLYGIWAIAWLTTQNLVTRLRSIAEHSMTPDVEDPFQNTRTVKAGPLARLLAPNRVNYHLEHHLVMTVPAHQLPRFHRMLRERELLDDACVSPGYASVLRDAVRGRGGPAISGGGV